jgi:hypothetical protein
MLKQKENKIPLACETQICHYKKNRFHPKLIILHISGVHFWCVCMSVCVCVCVAYVVYVCVLCIISCVCVYIYVCMCVYICVCVYMYI